MPGTLQAWASQGGVPEGLGCLTLWQPLDSLAHGEEDTEAGAVSGLSSLTAGPLVPMKVLDRLQDSFLTL